MVVHEGCHGFVSEAHGLKLKTVGVGMFTLIPLAFVNPDEKKLIKAPKKVQLSIFAAGPFANLVTAGVVLLLFTFLLIPITANNFEAKGIYVTDVGPEWHCKYFSSHFECPAEYPVEEAGLRKGEVIIGLNGQRTENITSFVVELNKLKPEQKISLMLEDRSIELTTSENIKNTSKAYLGLNLKQNIQLKEDSENKYGKLPWLALYISQLFYWLFALNIGIGLINLLPLGIVDGGRMVSIALSKVKNKRLAAKLFFFITMFSLFVLIFNLIGPYFKGLIL
jgi:membrane-associated protease RseP (regulator of RpoE activity)